MTAPGGRTPPKVPRPERAPLATSPAIQALTAQVAGAASAAERDAAVAAFWSGPGARSPLVEPVPGEPGQRLVTFVWQDAEAGEVLLFANRMTDERNLADSLMRRVPGTDVWHLTYRMGSTWRASYAFVVRESGQPAPWTDGADQVRIRAALDRGRPDPRNAAVTTNRAGARQSVVSLPDAPPQPWVAARPGPVAHGTLTERDGPDGRRLWVYVPPVAAEWLPLVVVLDGEVWTGTQDLPTTMDNLLADDVVRPAVLVMVDSGGRDQRWAELGDAVGTAGWVADRLVPWARAELGVGREPGDVVVAGQSLGGLVALACVVAHPQVVGAALAQSASLWLADLEPTVAAARLTGVRAYVEVGAQEWVLRGPNARLARALAEAGADVKFVEYDGGHDYACWRGGIADGLRHLLPRD